MGTNALVIRLHMLMIVLAHIGVLSAFFIADQYVRALGVTPDEGEAHDIAHRVMDVAAGRLDVAGLAHH